MLALLGEVLQEEDADQHTDNHQDPVWGKQHDRLGSDNLVDGDAGGNVGILERAGSHQLADLCAHFGLKVAEEQAGEDAQADTGDDREGHRDNAHDRALSAGEPVADQQRDKEAAPELSGDQRQDKEDSPKPGLGGRRHADQRAADQRDDADVQTGALGRLDLTDARGDDEVGDQIADDAADHVQKGHPLRAAVKAVQDVLREVGECSVPCIGQDLIDHQQPAAGTKAEALVLIHVYTSPCFGLDRCDKDHAPTALCGHIAGSLDGDWHTPPWISNMV